jgi:general secretion pathway protein I
MSTRRSEAGSGYTLIELLVAMMVLAMALVVLMRIFSTGLTAIGTSEGYVDALQLAESRLAAAGVVEPLRPGSQSGEEGDYRWTELVESYEPEDSSDALTRVDDWPVPAYLVTVTVAWQGAAGERSVDLSTLKLQLPERRR